MGVGITTPISPTIPVNINMCAQETIPALKVYPSMPTKVTFRAGTYSLLIKMALSFGRLSHAKLTTKHELYME